MEACPQIRPSLYLIGFIVCVVPHKSPPPSQNILRHCSITQYHVCNHHNQLQKVTCSDQQVNSTFIIRKDCDDLKPLIIIGLSLHNGSSVVTQSHNVSLEVNQTYSLTVQIDCGSCIIATNAYQLGEN